MKVYKSVKYKKGKSDKILHYKKRSVQIMASYLTKFYLALTLYKPTLKKRNQ